MYISYVIKKIDTGKLCPYFEKCISISWDYDRSSQDYI